MPSSLQIKAFISWENLVRGVQMESCGHLSGVPVSLSTLGFSLRTLSTFSASSQQGLLRKRLKRLQIYPICVVPRGFTPFHQCTLASTNSLILQWNSYLCPLCLYQVSQCSYSVSLKWPLSLQILEHVVTLDRFSYKFKKSLEFAICLAFLFVLKV